jgi:hypothetical protein
MSGNNLVIYLFFKVILVFFVTSSIFVYNFSRFKYIILFYSTIIFMIESEQRNKIINSKLEIHIET